MSGPGCTSFSMFRVDAVEDDDSEFMLPPEPVVVGRRDLALLVDAMVGAVELLESELLACSPVHYDPPKGQRSRRADAYREGMQAKALADDVAQALRKLYPHTQSSSLVRAPLGPCGDFAPEDEEGGGPCGYCGWPHHDHDSEVVGVGVDTMSMRPTLTVEGKMLGELGLVPNPMPIDMPHADRAYAEGRHARMTGQPIGGCVYAAGTVSREAFERGWLELQAKQEGE